MPLKVGDQATQGGRKPILMIEAISEDGKTATCSWVNKAKDRKKDDFPVETLTKHEFIVGVSVSMNRRFP